VRPVFICLPCSNRRHSAGHCCRLVAVGQIAFASTDDVRKERQREGIAKAQAAGDYKGRKPSVPIQDIRRLKAEGVRPSEIASRLKVGRARVYRAIAH